MDNTVIDKLMSAYWIFYQVIFPWNVLHHAEQANYRLDQKNQLNKFHHILFNQSALYLALMSSTVFSTILPCTISKLGYMIILMGVVKQTDLFYISQFDLIFVYKDLRALTYKPDVESTKTP